MDDIKSLVERLSAMKEEAEAIMNYGGTPGAAIAVIHEGELVHTEYLGVRDIEKDLPINDETIFPCASLTQAVVAATVATYVEDGSFSWYTPVTHIVPELNTKDGTLNQQMTAIDCLSHRSGLQPSTVWLGSENEILVSPDDSLDFINELRGVTPFRDVFLPNNVGYEIAAHMLTRVSGQPWGQTVQEKIFDPLDMNRTSTQEPSEDETNVAKTYMTLDDTSNVPIPSMKTSDATFGGPGTAMRSCIKDLVALYTAFLIAGKDQMATGATRTFDNPLKQVPYLWSSKVTMDMLSVRDTSYALGWARVQTPGPMGALGSNPSLLYTNKVPDVAKGHESRLILYNQGGMPGSLAAVNLIPETGGAIIVLTNSLALNDTADWIGQLYLEAYLGVEDKNDYMSLAKESAENALDWFPQMCGELYSQQIFGTQPRDLSAYTGTFLNKKRTMKIEVFVDPTDETLKMSFQGLDSEVFPLDHYHYDVFTWLRSRDEFARRGRTTSLNCDAEYFKITFDTGESGDYIEYLTWWHDRWLPEAEMFVKEPPELTIETWIVTQGFGRDNFAPILIGPGNFSPVDFVPETYSPGKYGLENFGLDSFGLQYLGIEDPVNPGYADPTYFDVRYLGPEYPGCECSGPRCVDLDDAGPEYSTYFDAHDVDSDRENCEDCSLDR